jgi:dipeptidase D
LDISKDLNPEKVFYYFEKISSIPRGSKKEKKISDYLVEFARYRGLEVMQDSTLNVIIKKKATPGYEDVPGIILQGHMDMVWEKNQDTEFDFESQGIKLTTDGDWISAAGTTLGADNGIAVAFFLALLDSKDIPHPSLEILITSDEETGMTGAKALDGSYLKGKYLINIDTEEEGALYVSCAGGLRFTIAIPFNVTNTQGDNLFRIRVTGLQGGHSGADIGLQRGNSIKILGIVLKKIFYETNMSLVNLMGGSKTNAIPRESEAIILVKSPDEKSLQKIIEIINTELKEMLNLSDPNIKISIEKITDTTYDNCLDKISTQKLINAILLHPNGVVSMSLSIENLVESSLNLGKIRIKGGSMIIESAIRSSVDQKLDEIAESLMALADLSGGSFEAGSRYPAWKYRENSKLRDHMASVYSKLFGKSPNIKAIHAGLECGLLGEKLPDVDMISFGPDIRGAHTPQESISISSTKNSWEFILRILRDSKNIL